MEDLALTARPEHFGSDVPRQDQLGSAGGGCGLKLMATESCKLHHKAYELVGYRSSEYIV